MHSPGFSRKCIGSLAGLALTVSSSGALAAGPAAPQPRAISPLVALSALGSEASRTALCASSISAASAAFAQGAEPRGCVLPVVDQLPPAAPVSEVLPPPPVPPPPMPVVAGGLGSSTLLFGLVGLAGAILLAVVLLGRGGNNGNDRSPT